jgi:hypothetical protein
MKGEKAFDWKEKILLVLIGQKKSTQGGANERLLGLETLLLVGV